MRIHIAVALLWGAPKRSALPLEYCVVDHINEDTKNFTLENMQFITKRQNTHKFHARFATQFADGYARRDGEPTSYQQYRMPRSRQIQGRMEVACANRVFHLHAMPEDDIVDQLSGGMPGAARLSPSHR